MTDTNTAGADGAPHIEPVAVAPELSDFDKQLDEFLNHSMMDDAPAGDAVDPEPKVNVSPPAPVVGAPAVDPSSAPKGAGEVDPTTGEPAKAPAAADPAVVDPALVMEVLGFTAPAAPAPAATPAPAASTASGEPAPSAPAADDAPFMPFRNDFKLPVEMTSALFESEDSETRSKALVALLSSAMNTLAQVVDERVKQYHAPRIAQQFEGRQNYERNLNNFKADFYGETGGYPDLLPYESIVGRTIQVLAKQNPNMPWPEARERVATLARTVVKQMTGKDITPAPKVPAAAPPAKPAHDAFLTGGGRPAGVGDPADAASPAALLADMTQF